LNFNFGEFAPRHALLNILMIAACALLRGHGAV
jgi:hypothetical protein